MKKLQMSMDFLISDQEAGQNLVNRETECPDFWKMQEAKLE